MRKYLFADESGCMTFKRAPNISRYFILCTVLMDPTTIGPELMHLRRELAWRGFNQDDCIHCTSDPQAVRDEVFALLAKHDFRIDATVLEKSKAQPQTRSTEIRFYQYAWYYHFKHVGPRLFAPNDDALICAASLGTNKKRAGFRAAINNVVQQSIRSLSWKTAFWPAASDPCLLVADYCCWAIRRKWENGDERSYSIIQEKIATEFDLWRSGTRHYY